MRPARFLLGLWLALGVMYAGTTLAAEYCYKRGAATVDTDIPSALKWMGRSAMLAPELQYLRVGPARLAMMRPQGFRDDAAIAVLADELRNDPLSLDILANLMVRYAMTGNQREAMQIFLHMRAFAPNSKPVQAVMKSVQAVPQG